LLPVYFTVQYHPIAAISGLFVKGSIGYNFHLSVELVPEEMATTAGPFLDKKNGGVFWQVSTGYEYDWGLLLEAFYRQSYFSATWDMTGFPQATTNYAMNNLGFSIGYKIRL
jgi:hypothetical protein